MTEDKSIFDKLFEQVMGEADEETMELGIDIPAADEDGEDAGADFDAELSGDGEEVTITLKPEHVELLKDILAQVGGEEEGEEEGEEDAGEELAGDEELGGEELGEPVEEETHATNDGAEPGVDPSNGGGDATEPAADSLGGKSTGEGDSKVTDEEGSKETKEGSKTGEDPSGLTNPGHKIVKK